jgi:energy-coupling factor transporter ATP-binding protein EcfA2
LAYAKLNALSSQLGQPTMLRSLKYSEYRGDPREWRLEHLELEDVNLLVGRNATGKSRVLSVVAGLAQVLSGKQQTAFQSGSFDAEFDLEHGHYEYALHIENSAVVRESLRVNDAPLLERGRDGKGKIWYEALGDFVSFELDARQFALPNKRDKLQHPFAVQLGEWAAGVTLLPFGSELGRRVLQGPVVDRSTLVGLYVEAWRQHGEAYDNEIIRGMRRLGYPVSEVHAKPMPADLFPGVQDPPIGLVVRDDELGIEVPQPSMSQGMYRALALIIHLNAAALSGARTLCLIDDIGEGLDYERASTLVDISTELSQRGQLQLVMTSNDRFVMNKVSLQNWVVLERKKKTVSAFTAKNSRQAFEDFKFLGLSNFDFFTAGRYH